MYRELCIGLLSLGAVCVPAHSEDNPPLTAGTTASVSALKQAAEAQADNWEALSKSLGARIAGLLPCDQKITAAIEETRAASDARLSAAGDYFRGALAAAASAETVARNLLSEAPDNIANGRFIEMERTEAERERMGIDSQISQLVASSVVRRELSFAEQSLREIAILVDRRNLVLTRQVAFERQRRVELERFAEQIATQETALQEAAAAFNDEADRWRAYYAARLDRTKAECEAVSNPVKRRVPVVPNKKR